MAEHVLDIELRKDTGKEAAHKARQRGYIPAVLYGYKGNKVLAVKALDFERIFEEIGEHSIINLNIENKEKAEVIVKDFQLNPVTREIIHIDFLEFERGKALRREAIISTALGHGLAFPHVRSVEGGGLSLALGLSPKGIKFDAPDKTLTRVVFFVVVPTAVNAFYLRLLAGLTDTFRDAPARKELLSHTEPQKLWKALKRMTKKAIS